MIETAGDLIGFVLRASGINGVGQSPLAEDTSTGLGFLRMLMAQWQRKRWLIWHEQEVSVLSTGARYYTIGAGQDFNVGRPDKIHAAWVRLQPFSNPVDRSRPYGVGPYGVGPYGRYSAANTGTMPVDLHLSIIEAKEDWASITIKNLSSIPAAVFYDSAFPVGRVYFWPVPIAAHYEMHLVVKGSLPVYAALTDPLNLPDEYIEALVWSLCVRMQMGYGLPARPDHVAAMKQATETVKMANSQIGLLSMPAALSGRRGDVSSWAGRGLNQAWTTGGGSVLS